VDETDNVRAALARGATDPKPWVRYYACQSLGKLRNVEGTEVLLARIHDEAGQVRVAAIDALAHLDDPRARSAVCDAAAGNDADVRRAALRGLGSARIESALPLLLQAADSPDPLTRLVAIGSLARFDESGATEALARAARDPDERVRNAAFEGLVSNRNDVASTSLAALLSEPSLRDRVLTELTARGTETSRRILATAANEHPDSEVRRLASDASRA
jgi:HEAT repeat protein